MALAGAGQVARFVLAGRGTVTSMDDTFGGGDGVVVRVPCGAPPEAAWELLATPARWPRWSPQIRAVGGFDPVRRRFAPAPPALQVGAWVVLHGPWPVRLRAQITRLEADRRWDFAAPLPGALTLLSAHAVTRATHGCEIVWGMRVQGPGGGLLTRTALPAYTPLARLALRRLARLAQRQAARPEASPP